MHEVIIKFEEDIKENILKYLQKNNFFIINREINNDINSYKLILEKNEGIRKYISIDFCLHHYDLFDGISVKLYTEKDILTPIKTELNIIESLLKNHEQLTRKIYGQTIDSINEIENDLKKYFHHFIETDNLSDYNNYFDAVKKIFKV